MVTRSSSLAGDRSRPLSANALHFNSLVADVGPRGALPTALQLFRPQRAGRPQEKVAEAVLDLLDTDAGIDNAQKAFRGSVDALRQAEEEGGGISEAADARDEARTALDDIKDEKGERLHRLAQALLPDAAIDGAVSEGSSATRLKDLRDLIVHKSSARLDLELVQQPGHPMSTFVKSADDVRVDDVPHPHLSALELAAIRELSGLPLGRTNPLFVPPSDARLWPDYFEAMRHYASLREQLEAARDRRQEGDLGDALEVVDAAETEALWGDAVLAPDIDSQQVAANKLQQRGSYSADRHQRMLRELQVGQVARKAVESNRDAILRLESTCAINPKTSCRRKSRGTSRPTRSWSPSSLSPSKAMTPRISSS